MDKIVILAKRNFMVLAYSGSVMYSAMSAHGLD
jgi:hypothetical protein